MSDVLTDPLSSYPLSAETVAFVKGGLFGHVLGGEVVEGSGRETFAVYDPSSGTEIGRGLSAYDADDAAAIRGRSSGEIQLVLGFAGRTAMIHRDDLVLAGG